LKSSDQLWVWVNTRLDNITSEDRVDIVTRCIRVLMITKDDYRLACMMSGCEVQVEML